MGFGQRSVCDRVAQGIRDTDPSALQTVELNFVTSSSLDDLAWAPLIDLNASYTYDPAYVLLLKDYNRNDFLPNFFVEGSYEDEQNSSTVPAGTPQQLRRQEYWSLLSGVTGQLFGNHSIWQFLCSERDADGNCVGGWKDQLHRGRDADGSRRVAILVSAVVRTGARPGSHAHHERVRVVRRATT